MIFLTRESPEKASNWGRAQGGMKGKAEPREGENGQTQQYLHDESGSIPPKGWRRGLATVRGSLVSLFLPFFSFSSFSCPSCLVCPYCATPVGLPCVGGRISDMYGVIRSINKIKTNEYLRLARHSCNQTRRAMESRAEQYKCPMAWRCPSS